MTYFSFRLIERLNVKNNELTTNTEAREAASHPRNAPPSQSPIDLDSTRIEPIPESPPTERPSTLSAYFRDIGQETLLSAKEEVELSQRVKMKDEAARQRMIRANPRLVVRIAREFEGMGQPLLDLINEGNIGLMRAVEKFDPEKGAKFSTYSAFWIKHAMRLSLSNHTRTVRIPVHMVDRIAKMRKVEMKYQDSEGRAPTDEELAQELELSAHQMRVLRQASLSQVSLDSPVEEGEDRSLKDRIADESAANPWDDLESDNNTQVVGELMDGLREREAKILRHRFGFGGQDPMTLEEIGQLFGVTRERIRQIEAAALQKMRKHMTKMEKAAWKN
jgi:RNA polymerase primary sigma factor